MGRYPTILQRVALAIPEKRVELGLSLSELARLADVSRSTVTKIERGGGVASRLVVQVALALLILELHELPATLDDERATFTRPTLALPAHAVLLPPNDPWRTGSAA
jgi:transcriptional regulator with XRE-family HTH domain